MESYEVKKILVPLDGSVNSIKGLEKAIYFARQCQATITGIYVSQKPSRFGFDSIENMSYAKRKQVDKFMEKAKNTAGKKGIEFYSKIIHGTPDSKILEYAKKWNFKLIVMGSRGAGSEDKSFIGSVANHVIHKATIPVIVVK